MTRFNRIQYNQKKYREKLTPIKDNKTQLWTFSELHKGLGANALYSLHAAAINP